MKKLTLTDELRGIVKGRTLDVEVVTEHYCIHVNAHKYNASSNKKWAIAHLPTGFAVIYVRRKCDAVAVAKAFEAKAPVDDHTLVEETLRPLLPAWKDYLTSGDIGALLIAIKSLEGHHA